MSFDLFDARLRLVITLFQTDYQLKATEPTLHCLHHIRGDVLLMTSSPVILYSQLAWKMQKLL